MNPSELDACIVAAIEVAEKAKPNDRSEKDRWTQVVITDLQKARALAAFYGIGDPDITLNVGGGGV